MSNRYIELIDFVRQLYGSDRDIPLHEPVFDVSDIDAVKNAVTEGTVSSIGNHTTRFEESICAKTKIPYAVSMNSGTSALQIGLIVAGVQSGDEVITQALNFIAGCNAISYCGAKPVFLDVERSTLGLSPDNLEEFLFLYAEIRDDGYCWNHKANRRIRACMPMHTFGHPVRIDRVLEICNKYNVVVVEDSAEALGSTYQSMHVGNSGLLSVLSFNGNKIVTGGSGGALVTHNAAIASRARHLVANARIPHAWDYDHDSIGFNYRMPNLNAALAYSQMNSLEQFLVSKREIANNYWGRCQELGIEVVVEPNGAQSNYWLNVILTSGETEKLIVLREMHKCRIKARPAWTPLHLTKVYKDCFRGDLQTTNYLADRLVCLPSSALITTNNELMAHTR